MQKLTGIDFITTSAPEIFGLTGFKGNKPALLISSNFISYTASLALAIYLIDCVSYLIFALVNAAILIPIYLFYIGMSSALKPPSNKTLTRIPETANRHLEDLDFLFASNSPLVWKAEKEFSRQQALVARNV